MGYHAHVSLLFLLVTLTWKKHEYPDEAQLFKCNPLSTLHQYIQLTDNTQQGQPAYVTFETADLTRLYLLSSPLQDPSFVYLLSPLSSMPSSYLFISPQMSNILPSPSLSVENTGTNQKTM